MRLFSSCFLGCCLFFQTVNVNAMGCLQFARQTAQEYGINKEIPLKIETDFDVDEGIQKDVIGRLSVFVIFVNIKEGDFFGLFFESLGDAIGVRNRELTVECYHQAANYGNVSATIKWARAVFVQYSLDLFNYRQEVVEKIQKIVSVVKAGGIINPQNSVELFKLLASYYCGEGTFEKAEECYREANVIASTKMKEPYKSQALESVSQAIKNLENLKKLEGL